MDRHVTIRRKKEEDDFYSQLQKHALKEIQSLAGELWTDYNEHDPGVTIVDALNYVLLETDYRLQFDWKDYLSAADGGFIPEMHALFPPLSVFPVNPVTVADYRKLLLSSIDGLSDVQVNVHKESGTYDFLLDVGIDIHNSLKEEIKKEVCALFHAHRNLCENLGQVDFTVQEFQRSDVRFRRVDELLAEGKAMDEILEGPIQKRMIIGEESMCPHGTYRKLFEHVPVLQDFPECYREYANDGFVNYLAMFDDLINRSLHELQSLPLWMSTGLSELTDKKEAWMDMLDRLYGENSNPPCLMKYEKDAERRARRMAFLKRVPAWGRDRGKAMNLQVFSTDNRSGLEEYMRSLLNFEKQGIEMFLLEHNLLGVRQNKCVVAPEDAFRISVILSAGLDWLEDEEFRHACERLIIQRVPAHIRTKIYWLEKDKAGGFRSDFLFWQYLLTTSAKKRIATLSDNLRNRLADDNNWYSKV